MLTPKHILGLLLFTFVLSLDTAAEDIFLGPAHLRRNENGDLVAAPPQAKPAFDNLWAYRLYPEQKILTGQGVTVAIADSGINSHQEFNGKNIQGKDFTLSPSIADMKNHGTGIAGVIGARGVKFTGLAPNAQIIVYKIDDGSRMIGPQAATAAVNTVLSYNKEHPNQKIAVLNLSYGIHGGGDKNLTHAINAAHDSGVAVICPAGNTGMPGVFYPANLGTTIAVGALAANKQQAYANSAYGNEVDFIAPGESIYLPTKDGDYMMMSGTSIATGFVTAAAALAVEGFQKKYGRAPSADEIKQSLINAAAQIPGIAGPKQGYGFIDVKKLEEQFK